MRNGNFITPQKGHFANQHSEPTYEEWKLGIENEIVEIEESFGAYL